MMNKVNAGVTRAYLAYKNVLAKRDGASTVEYVAVLGAAVVLGGVLLSVLGDQEETIGKKVEAIINKIKTGK